MHKSTTTKGTVQMRVKLEEVLSALLDGVGGNTDESVAALLSLIGHVPGRYEKARHIRNCLAHGAVRQALSAIDSYIEEWELLLREQPRYRWERELEIAIARCALSSVS